MQIDDFWRANYTRMVRYCCTIWDNEQDVEEVVADVIYKHFDEFSEKIEARGLPKFNIMRRWMNRRVLLDLKTRHFKLRNRMETHAVENDDGDVTMPDPLHWDTPENILDLAQRLPEPHPILIEYEAFGKLIDKDVPAGQKKLGGQRGENNPNDRVKFCRERKKFLTALAA